MLSCDSYCYVLNIFVLTVELQLKNMPVTCNQSCYKNDRICETAIKIAKVNGWSIYVLS